MITICPNGGLGNQLFQYAAGRALALHHGVELEIDTWHYGAIPEAGARPLLLHRLGLPARWRFYPARGPRAAHSVPQRVYRQVLRPIARTEVRDDPAMVGDQFFAMQRTSVLSGDFQSIRFFAPYADRIKRDINLERIATSHALEF